MKKKFVSIFLTISLVGAMLAGCGSSDPRRRQMQEAARRRACRNRRLRIRLKPRRMGHMI